MSDKLKNVWKQIKTNVKLGIHIIEPDVVPLVKSINKEVTSRANKAPWYKEQTYKDLNLAYKDAGKNLKKNKKKN